MFNPNELEIRFIRTPDELEQVIQLNLVEWPTGTYGAGVDAEKLTREQYKDELRHTLVAVNKNGLVVGTAGLVERDVYNVFPDEDIRASKKIYCSRLVVHEQYRKRGIAKKLLIAREKLANELGYSTLFLLNLGTRDSELCKMHLRNGWNILKEGKHEKFESCVVLTKDLPRPALKNEAEKLSKK